MKNKECEAHIIISFKDYINIVEDIPNILKKNNIKKIEKINQENIYFDDVDNTLEKRKITFRKRIIYLDKVVEELTLKIPGEDGDIEINETVSSHPLIDQTLSKPFDQYHEVAKLFTKRIEIKFPDYLLVLDENKYHGIIDYDIEIESDKSKEHAYEVLDNYINHYRISFDKNTLSQSKALRARLAKRKNEKL